MLFRAAVRVDVSQMRSSASASRHHISIVRPESLAHPTTLQTSFASNFHIESLPTSTNLVKCESSFAILLALVDEVEPWKVVKMPPFANNHEASWHRHLRLLLSRAIVDVSCLMWSVGFYSGLKKSRTNGSQKSALRAD